MGKYNQVYRGRQQRRRLFLEKKLKPMKTIVGGRKVIFFQNIENCTESFFRQQIKRKEYFRHCFHIKRKIYFRKHFLDHCKPKNPRTFLSVTPILSSSWLQRKARLVKVPFYIRVVNSDLNSTDTYLATKY